jgi:20S proteasome alpha/beta subunit
MLRLLNSLRIIILGWILHHAFGSSYNVYNYDLSTPVFTPDGLLKQVEYASLSSSHSTPIVLLSSHCIKGCNQGTFLVIATSKENASEKRNQEMMSKRSQNAETRSYTQQGQSRIIQIPIQDMSDSSIVVGVSGILPDAVSLVQSGRDLIHSLQSAYGMKSMDPLSCAREVAECIADKCEQHALGGGMRPYGAEVFVCAIKNTNDSVSSKWDVHDGIVYITQPSGGLFVHRFRKSDGIANNVLVLGGDEKIKSDLRNNIENDLKQLEEGPLNDSTSTSSMSMSANTPALKIAIQMVAKILEKHNFQRDSLDIVVVDSTKGTIRLTNDDIRKLLL